MENLAKALITVLEEVTQDALDKSIADCVERTAAKERLYKSRRDSSGFDGASIDRMEKTGSCGIQGMYSLRGDYLAWQNDKLQSQSEVREIKEKKPRAASVCLAIINSFGIKDHLKAAEYVFKKDINNPAEKERLGLAYYSFDNESVPVAAWVKSIAADPVSLKEIVNHLKSLNVDVVLRREIPR